MIFFAVVEELIGKRRFTFLEEDSNLKEPQLVSKHR